MGQYYKPVNIDKMQMLYSHNFGSGLKLMEHSYIGNKFVEAVERLLSPKGAWHKCKFCWAGDYMDDGLFVEGEGNLYCQAEHDVMGAKDELAKLDTIKDWGERRDKAEILTEEWAKTLPKKGKFLTNHTKEICLDMTKEEPFDTCDGTPWTINPLPLLTCSGNGRGGGDYRKEDEYVGDWAGDVISMEHEPMFSVITPMNFTEG